MHTGLKWTGSKLACLALAAMLAATPAAAQKSADTLRIAWRDALADLDPYHNTLRTGLVLAHQSWDTLIYRDPQTFQFKPLLATTWRQTDDLTWEFTLRPGVRFHDGSPFTAADVVYTVQSILADPALAVPGNFAYLAGAERIDDTHVRIKLRRVFPAALDYIAMVLPILPQAYRERVGAAGYSRAPVGTGPYRIARSDSAEIDLDRWDGYFDGPKGRPAIAHLQIHEVADATTEVTEVLAGRADWIWMFNPDQFDVISRDPALQALRAESMRIGYLSLDAAGRTGADNPLTKQKVRQAVAHAIDRQAIARLFVQGGSRVLDAACFPTQFGCDQTGVAHYDYDPAAARRLLAEAGYPDGFDTELVSYVLPQYGQAMQTYLKAVGINARLSQLTVGEAVARSAAGKNPLYAGSWGSYSVNDVSAILPYFFDGKGDDYARDPELERLVAAGSATTNPDERRKLYSEALRRISEQMYWLPLSTYVTTYAFARTLNFRPSADELPRFFLSSWR